MSFKKIIFTTLVVTATFVLHSAAQATVIPVVEDVMTSGFFTGANLVRGYSGEARNVHRVSTNGPFSTPGAETIYLTFDSANFSGFSSPVASAILTMQSVAGAIGYDADLANPFTVSAHAVDTDPLTAIIDDSNTTPGTISWVSFFDNNILAADSAALTVVDSFGTVTFDVTAVVNDWVSGANTEFTLAMTGKNDTSSSSFLHGFLNNSENPGSTFLTVTAVPEPTSIALLLLGCVGVGAAMRRRVS